MDAKITINTTAQRKRLAKLLAVKLNMDDMTDLINHLLDQAIETYLTPEMIASVLGEEQLESRVASKKSRSARRA